MKSSLKKLSLIFITLSVLTNAYNQKTEIMYLSGTGNNNTKKWDFYCTKGNNSGKWTTIEVPSCWEQQGFGAYNYGYDNPDHRADEQGLYKYQFNVPPEWMDKTVNIVFDGSMTDTEVKINSKLAGDMHQGAFYRFKYDITKLLSFDKPNLLEVTVSKVSSNESVNKAERNADYWIFGGIFRPVYLEVKPKECIDNVRINTSYKGEFTAEINLSAPIKDGYITLQLNNEFGDEIDKEIKVKIPDKDKTVNINTLFKNVIPWSTEFPELYTATFKLIKDGNIIHQVTDKIGFRTIELRKRDGVYLNGVKIKFKGVNRHSFWPESGRTLNRQLSIKDVNLVKEMNMNAVRNSHYPADEHFYDACDSLGVMVLDELAGWHDAYDTKVGNELVKEMIAVSHNHPCVVMWVNGNEGGHNRELLPLYKMYDLQQRHVLQAWEIFDGVDTQHYRDYNYGVGSHYQGHDVFFPTEFLHGVYDGGHGASLYDFWNLMCNNPLSAGGFLWNFADEGIVRRDWNDSIDTDGNHGADGIMGPHREKEGSFYTIKEVWSPVYFENREITPEFDGKFRVENRYYFTNLKQCNFTWELKKLHDPYNSETESQKGMIISPDIEPYCKDTLGIALPENWKEYDVLYITAKDPRKKEIFTWSWPISLPDKIAERIVIKEGNKKPVINESDTSLKATSNGVSFTVSKLTGLVEDINNQSGHISFSNGPVLCEGYTNFKSLNYHYEKDNLVIESTFEKQTSYQEVKWTIYPSGWIKLDVEYCPEVERSVLMGINFSYPEELITGMTWYGDGPYRVWKNRIRGTKLNVWHKDYNNTITGEPPYIYPEFKGYHSNMYWLTVETKEQPFTIVCPDEDVFFRMLTPSWPKEPFNTAPPFPDGDISFLHGITPIGTKPLSPDRMGPSGQKNIYYTYEKTRCKTMQLYFDFTGKK